MRRAAAIMGLLSLAAIWAVPQAVWPVPGFPAHMVRHVVLIAVAAPLLVFGLPRGTGWLAIPPVPAAALEFVVVWGWHLPAPHAAARLAMPAFIAEQASFLLVGLAVWAGARRAHPLAGAAGLLLTSMHMTVLGALLILAPRDLYSALGGRMADLAAQQWGGLIMLAVATPIYLVAGLLLVRRALRQEGGVA